MTLFYVSVWLIEFLFQYLIRKNKTTSDFYKNN